MIQFTFSDVVAECHVNMDRLKGKTEYRQPEPSHGGLTDASYELPRPPRQGSMWSHMQNASLRISGNHSKALCIL